MIRNFSETLSTYSNSQPIVVKVLDYLPGAAYLKQSFAKNEISLSENKRAASKKFATYLSKEAETDFTGFVEFGLSRLNELNDQLTEEIKRVDMIRGDHPEGHLDGILKAICASLNFLRHYYHGSARVMETMIDLDFNGTPVAQWFNLIAHFLAIAAFDQSLCEFYENHRLLIKNDAFFLKSGVDQLDKATRNQIFIHLYIGLDEVARRYQSWRETIDCRTGTLYSRNTLGMRATMLEIDAFIGIARDALASNGFLGAELADKLQALVHLNILSPEQYTAEEKAEALIRMREEIRLAQIANVCPLTIIHGGPISETILQSQANVILRGNSSDAISEEIDSGRSSLRQTDSREFAVNGLSSTFTTPDVPETQGTGVSAATLANVQETVDVNESDPKQVPVTILTFSQEANLQLAEKYLNQQTISPEPPPTSGVIIEPLNGQSINLGDQSEVAQVCTPITQAKMRCRAENHG